MTSKNSVRLIACFGRSGSSFDTRFTVEEYFKVSDTAVSFSISVLNGHSSYGLFSGHATSTNVGRLK